MNILSRQALDRVRVQPFYKEHKEFRRLVNLDSIFALFDKGYDPTTSYLAPTFVGDSLYETNGIMELFVSWIFHGQEQMYDVSLLDPIFVRFSLSLAVNQKWSENKFVVSFICARASRGGHQVLNTLFTYFIREHHWYSSEFFNMLWELQELGLHDSAQCMVREICLAQQRSATTRIALSKDLGITPLISCVVDFLGGDYLVPGFKQWK